MYPQTHKNTSGVRGWTKKHFGAQYTIYLNTDICEACECFVLSCSFLWGSFNENPLRIKVTKVYISLASNVKPRFRRTANTTDRFEWIREANEHQKKTHTQYIVQLHRRRRRRRLCCCSRAASRTWNQHVNFSPSMYFFSLLSLSHSRALSFSPLLAPPRERFKSSIPNSTNTIELTLLHGGTHNVARAEGLCLVHTNKKYTHFRWWSRQQYEGSLSTTKIHTAAFFAAIFFSAVVVVVVACMVSDIMNVFMYLCVYRSRMCVCVRVDFYYFLSLAFLGRNE